MLPTGWVCHSTPGRLRIRIPSRRGDVQLFTRIEKVMGRSTKVGQVQVQPLTASVLLTGQKIDAGDIGALAAEKKLFRLEGPQPQAILAKALIEPLGRANQRVSRFTGGEVNIEGLIFSLLLAFGIYELLRGNLQRPPWYTAFWYAFGIFTKSIVDSSSKKAKEHAVDAADPAS